MEELQRMNDEQNFYHSYAFWQIYEYGNDDERNLLRQQEPDTRAWSGMVHKYRIGELLLDKLRECTHRIQLLLQDEEGQRGLQEINAILEPYLMYLQPSHAAVRED